MQEGKNGIADDDVHGHMGQEHYQIVGADNDEKVATAHISGEQAAHITGDGQQYIAAGQHNEKDKQLLPIPFFQYQHLILVLAFYFLLIIGFQLLYRFQDVLVL